MSGIPAASFSRANITRIRAINAEAAAEIERVGELMLRGEETEDEFLHACELLHSFGEGALVERLLVASSERNDRANALHTKLFGSRDDEYDRAVAALAKDLGASLKHVRSNRLYSEVFACKRSGAHGRLESEAAAFLDAGCEVLVTYTPGDGIVADLYSTEPDSDHGVPLRLGPQGWDLESMFQ